MKLSTRILIIILIASCSASAQVTGLSGWNIFLDPGHSQKENMGIYGYSEAERNLRVGLCLQEFLLNLTDIDTVYISRTNDQQEIDLPQRTDYANHVGAAWFHSIHSNAGSPQKNSTLLLWGQYYDLTEKIPNGGKAMSDIMVDILTRGMRTDTDGSWGDCGFYSSWTTPCTPSWPGPWLHVNRESTMPSELSESGFHTNPRQNQIFMNAEWKKLEAMIFYWSILKFHQIGRPFVGICSGIVSDMETDIPINGAKITLNGQTYITDTYETLFYKYSNDPDQLHNGFYYFENLPDDILTMMVEADDYYNDTLQVGIIDTFFTFRDVKLVSKRAPIIVSTTPAKGDTNFPAWEDIIIEFSRAMNQASVENHLIFVPEAEETISWSDKDRKMTLSSDSLKFETNYTITISGNSTDLYGHRFDGNADGVGGDDFTLSFKTGPPDMTAPKIVSIYPPQNGVNIELHPIINVIYDEAIEPLSITPNIFKLERFADHSEVSGNLKHFVINEQSVFCFFPANKLFHNEIYINRIYPGLYDSFGNTVTNGKAFSFNTTEYDNIVTTIDNFESGVTNNWWEPQQSGSTGGIITEATNRSTDTEITNLLTASTTSLQLDYGWDVNAGSWLIREYLGGGAPRNVLFNSSFVMQVYIFGEGSGNKFRFAVDDRYPNAIAANHEVSPWYTIDWIGWKLVSWDMTNDGTGTWIGDGNLDGTLRFDSIQLTYNPGSPITGTIYFDDLRLVRKFLVNVTEPPEPLPNDFNLFQNYPNPFNSKTMIKYQIKGNRDHVSLEIYNLLGKKVRILVNEDQPGGEYLVSWDGKDNNGNDVASGIYIYKLSAGEFNEAKQMILVR